MIFSTELMKTCKGHQLKQVYHQVAVEQYKWMETVRLAGNGEFAESDPVSWGAYHAVMQSQGFAKDKTPGISSLLPLFHEDSKTPAMIKHALDLIKNAVGFLNPGQIPVVALDQPLFAIAKQIQWKYPQIYGENILSVMLGGLHTEMAFLKAIGTLLRDSGWTDVLVDAKIATNGVADSFLSASHVTRTRHAHQVTVCALYKLLKVAHEQYIISLAADKQPLPFDDWSSAQSFSFGY